MTNIIPLERKNVNMIFKKNFVIKHQEHTLFFPHKNKEPFTVPCFYFYSYFFFGVMAITRAGRPVAFSMRGHVTITMAPASATLSKFCITSTCIFP